MEKGKMQGQSTTRPLKLAINYNFNFHEHFNASYK